MQRQLYNQGGIMDAVPREGYFVGKLAKSIKKGVKKIGKGVKKFAKSDLGKAAMLAAGAYFAPTLLGKSAGFGNFGSLLKSGIGSLGSKASTAANFFKPQQASQLVQRSNVLSKIPDILQTPAGRGSDYGQFSRRLLNQTVSGGGDNKGGIKSLLSDLFQDEKKRNILSDVLKGATSIAGGKMAYDDQKRINEARQKSYDDYIARRDSIASELDQKVPELDIRMANGGRAGFNTGGFGSFKDFIESTGDNELMELYSEFLETGNFSRLEKKLKEKGYQPGEYAMGGRVEYSEGTPEMGMIDPNKAKQAKQMLGMGADQDLISTITGLSKEQIQFLERENKAEGGIMMMADLEDDYEREFMRLVGELMEQGFSQQEAIEAARDELQRLRNKFMAEGGIIQLDIRTNPQGTKEIDYREKGGFVPPVGIKEKADDIPAMLSNNEFVFTADAVRGMGNGNVNKGAKKMYALMNELEGKA